MQGLADLNVGGFAEVTGISCGSPGNCVATGDYEPDTHNSTAGFVAEEMNGQWQPARPVVGTPTTSFGHEQSEKLSVKVKPRTGGTPSGQVTVVASGTKLRVISLVKGTGSCTPPARKLRPGSYRLSGAYSGDGHYDGSAYDAKTLTVTR